MSYSTFKLAAVAASLAGLSLGGPAQGATVYKTPLPGTSEAPAHASPFGDLVGNAAAGRTLGAPGVLAGGGQALEALAPYNRAFVAADGGAARGAPAALLTALGGGQAHFNVHTAFAPGGEIRGRSAQIPEPASWALMIAGFGIAGMAIRWRRSAFRT